MVVSSRSPKPMFGFDKHFAWRVPQSPPKRYRPRWQGSGDDESNHIHGAPGFGGGWPLAERLPSPVVCLRRGLGLGSWVPHGSGTESVFKSAYESLYEPVHDVLPWPGGIRSPGARIRLAEPHRHVDVYDGCSAGLRRHWIGKVGRLSSNRSEKRKDGVGGRGDGSATLDGYESQALLHAQISQYSASADSASRGSRLFPSKSLEPIQLIDSDSRSSVRLPME